jgi:hypothetical protein
MHTIFWLQNLREETTLEDLFINGRIMNLREIGLNWMHLAQDGDKWRALVNTVMNPCISLKAGGGGIFLLSE